MKAPDPIANLLSIGLAGDEPVNSAPTAPLAPTAPGTMDFSDIPEGTWHLQGYELLEEIGRGGMGIIYKARQPHSNRYVALKRLRSLGENGSTGPASADRLKREGEAIASLDHPHILPVYELGLAEDGTPFFSMKLATGGSLAQLAKPVQEKTAIRYLEKIARAIAYAHSCGIIHRDLKPANILLDGNGEPAVADFGLAKWLDRPSDMTQSIVTLGSPGYMAPEQAHGGKVGFAADIYSLGVILFELLTGRLPFQGENALQVVHQTLAETAPSLRTFLPSVSRDLETICQRCLEREPTARYVTAADLAADLMRYLEGRPVVARPIHWGERGLRWTLRNRILTSFSVAAILLGIVSVVLFHDRLNVTHFLQSNEIARRSVVLLPLLNVDSAAANNRVVARWQQEMADVMADLGGAQVSYLPQNLPEWTGGGTKREIIAATKATGANYALSGVYRTAPGKPEQPTSVTIFLLKNDGKTLLRKWHWEAASFDVLLTHTLAKEIYGILDRGYDPAQPQKLDAVETNPVAANYFKIGDDLMRRRNLPDADRALACFESAIREAPGSVLARSYLALATTVRQSLSPDAKIFARGLQAGSEAVALEPENPAANRAYGVLLGMQGDFQKQLEYSLKAISHGYESERALGQLGYLYMCIGRPNIALQWYLKAKKASDQPSDYETYLGDALAMLGRYDEAEVAYHAASEFHPELADGWAGTCCLLLRQKKFPETIHLYESKKDSFLNTTEVARLGALISFFNHDFAKAAPLIETLIQKERVGYGDFSAMDWRVALARLDSTSPERSSRLLAECIAREEAQTQRFPLDNEAHYRLGAAYAVAHRSADALASLKKAIETGWLDNVSLELDPRWDYVRADPQFDKLLFQTAQVRASLNGINSLSLSIPVNK